MGPASFMISSWPWSAGRARMWRSGFGSGSSGCGRRRAGSMRSSPTELGRARGWVKRVIEEERFAHRELSIAAAGWRLGVPVTCYVSIGSDIIHAMPNCDGAALGQTSYTDFLIFARTVQDLEGGIFLNIGSAVTGPEVFLKALSMARNVAHQRGERIENFTTGVFDLIPLPDNYRDGPPGKEHPLYYYRPWKTLLCRTVAGGGQSYYICGDHRDTIPTLWHYLVNGVPA